MKWELTSDQLDTLWNARESDRADMSKRQDYYDGKHAIVGQDEQYVDGHDKSEVVSNWCQYIVNRFVGALTSMPYQLSRDNPLGETDEGQLTEDEVAERDAQIEAEKWGIEYYGEIAVDNNLEALDGENLRNALIHGYGVEVHSFATDSDEGEVRITSYDPREWVLVRDTNGVLQIAIRQVTLDANTVYNGELLDDELKIRTVYYADQYETFKYVDEDGQKGKWEVIERQTHHYGQVPVVEWRINEQRKSILTDAIISQVDAYNAADSQSGDELTQASDALLVLKGLSADWIEQNAATIRQKRVLPLEDTENSDAKYLSKTLEADRFGKRLERTRAHIHMMGEVPDVNQIVGTTGATSGIALKLMFTPMQEAASGMIAWLKKCMRDRVNLINAMSAKQTNRSEISNYVVGIQFQIPVNRIEEWQYIGSLDGIVSARTKLELLHDINDPERELQALAFEQKSQLPELEGPEAIAANERKVAETAVSMEAKAQEMIESIGASVRDAMERLVLRKVEAPSEPAA